MLRIKRAYEIPDSDDGTRVLVERLWPRGLSKERAAVDVWCKELAPSKELRQWYGHDPDRWDEFQERYIEEIKDDPALDRLRRLAAKGTVTLIIAYHDPERSNAVVLKRLLEADAGLVRMRA